ncbi:MAG: hypothetical protein GF384_03240 [Elusimicrobia bacterium]|nr:hypothetical protein [Elusimicrobiota bacterium]MBD3411941.1 hypothetical protein [Elusimicrobiota bacterium]
MGVVFLFLSFRSYIFNFDGVACATAVELGNPSFLVHGNHLIYGLVGFILYRSVSTILPMITSIHALQILNVFCAGISTSVFFLLMHALTHNRMHALWATLGMVFSFSFWFWHIEPQVYPLGFVFLVGASYILFTKQLTRRRCMIIGLIHACACFGHIVHVLFMPVVFFYMWHAHRDRSFKPVLIMWLHYAAIFTVILVTGYCLVILFIVKPASLDELVGFLAGSAGLSGQMRWQGTFTLARTFEWITTSVHAVFGWIMPVSMIDPGNQVYHEPVELNVLISSIPPFFANVMYAGFIVQYTSLILLSIVGLLCLVRLKDIINAHRSIYVALAVWIGLYAIFFITWEPGNITYHQSDLIPLWIGIGLGISTISTHRWHGVLLGIFSITLFLNTFINYVLPAHDPNGNHFLQTMKYIKKNLSPRDVLIIQGGINRVYIPYFARRYYIDLDKHKTAVDMLIDQHRSNGARFYAFPDITDSKRLNDLGVFYTIGTRIKSHHHTLIEIIPEP